MNKLLITILFFVANFYNSFGCNCKNKASIEESFRKCNIVILGKIIEKKEIQVWYDNSDGLIKTYAETAPISTYKNFKENGLWYKTIIQYKIFVIENFKGSITNDTVTLRTEFGTEECEFPFRIEKNYLIYGFDYAKPNKNTNSKRNSTNSNIFYRTDICTRTTIVTDTLKDVEILRMFK